MEQGMMGTLTEIAAVRSVLAAWITFSLRQSAQGALYIERIEQFSQMVVEKHSFANVDEETNDVLREMAAMHVSDICAGIAHDLQQT